ncbi:hypothetical protein DCS_06809 [Drechmeria coniospora]|uniref:Cytochrome c oxidase assembly protein COX20, mitochondrial n=1 Tax=Drechmeria coniospora TaxID=98403 RepID=A0A151GCM5_DRECN|nr:hypothetical protein DCS_06809 [Drechmeria coniospora]KYK54848.1 hypothetical protein DCS_06809 [Drechmeria coniospora]ODA75922.1 hypothetical protein RJ55_08563 [Drechmeria coniospora]
MAPNTDHEPPNPNQKTLHVWSKPIAQNDGQSTGGQQEAQEAGTAAANARPTISEAVSMIKTEDFATVATTPCARQGFLAGIASGAGLGGLKFVLHGNATKAANWAVGFFLLGSTLSYEYCQYRRRAERIQMKRHIEVVSENRRELARKAAEKQREQAEQEAERKAGQKAWYKFW